MRSARDDLRKDFDAKNSELSDVMTKAKERLDELTAEKEKLEIDYAELQKTNKVSTEYSKSFMVKNFAVFSDRSIVAKLFRVCNRLWLYKAKV